MNVVVSLPDTIARDIGVDERDIERKVLESLALEGYRSDRLTAFQVGQMLGFEVPMQVDEFLKAHGEFIEYTEEEIEYQSRILREFPKKK